MSFYYNSYINAIGLRVDLPKGGVRRHPELIIFLTFTTGGRISSLNQVTNFLKNGRYVPYELYVLHEVWQKSVKELVPRSEPVWLAEGRHMVFRASISSG